MKKNPIAKAATKEIFNSVDIGDSPNETKKVNIVARWLFTLLIIGLVLGLLIGLLAK